MIPAPEFAVLLVLLTILQLMGSAVLVHSINFKLNNLRRLLMTITELLTKIDSATNAVADRVAALIASIKASGQTLTAEQEAEAAAITAHLDAIGADAANPVPAPEPPAPPAPPVAPV